MLTPPHRRTYLGLALLSAASLTFEVSMTRAFAVQQFHHFAFVVVSLAVMGIAASGVLLSASRRHPPLWSLAGAFSISVAIAYAVINGLPFDSYSIAWDLKQVWILLAYFLVAGLPFLFTGWVVGACLNKAGVDAHVPYAANLAGSALGPPLALAAMSLAGVEGALGLSLGIGLLALVAFAEKPVLRMAALALAGLTLIIGLQPPSWLELRLSPYKPLAILRLASDAHPLYSRWSASTRIDVVESGTVHIFPGLSLNTVGSLPDQAALFLDGEGPYPITTFSPGDEQARTLSQSMPATIAYVLRPNADSLMLRPGAGLDAALSLAAGVSHLTIAFDEPLIQEVLTGPLAELSGDLLHIPRVSVRTTPGRSTLRSSSDDYDVVHIALSDAYRPVTSGAFSLTEEYMFTVDAFKDALSALKPDGLLVLTRWLGTPPSESARAWATLIAALKASGIQTPDEHLIAFRGMRTATMLASLRPYRMNELRDARAFLEANGYDPIYLPDLHPDELNRFNRLPQDVYHELYTALLENPLETQRAYVFNLQPPTDERPYFFHFFRWRQTPEVLAGLGMTWQPFGGSGYLVLLALLAMMLVIALPLAASPLSLLRRSPGWSAPGARSLLFFACLGAGYLWVEIPLMQRFTLLLDHPAISLATVLTGLLVASGLGSMLSLRVNIRAALRCLAILLCAYLLWVPFMVHAALGWNLSARVLLALGTLIPLGVLMGVPFAGGLRLLQRSSPGSIPWAWAVNGAVSGVSGVLAALISLDAGFNLTLGLGALAYAAASVFLPRSASAE